jgi:release factor glutamine methyltransferase
MTPMAKTYNDLYLAARRSLREAGVEAYGLEARLLVACAAEKSVETLLQELRLYTGDAVAEKSEELVARRLRGEPAAYITGSWEFYGMPMAVDPSVLIPRVDTEVLVKTAVDSLRGKKMDARILDLCSGSGCVGCAISRELPAARVVMVDISPAALSVARKNMLMNNLSARITCLEADVMMPPPMRIGSFDLIVSNPPYIPSAEIPELDISVRDYEPVWALDGGRDGLDFYRAILDGWKNILRPGGQLLFEVGRGQAEQVKKRMLWAGRRGVDIAQATAGIERVLSGRI